jgi:hypothetical protein
MNAQSLSRPSPPPPPIPPLPAAFQTPLYSNSNVRRSAPSVTHSQDLSKVRSTSNQPAMFSTSDSTDIDHQHQRHSRSTEQHRDNDPSTDRRQALKHQTFV